MFLAAKKFVILCSCNSCQHCGNEEDKQYRGGGVPQLSTMTLLVSVGRLDCRNLLGLRLYLVFISPDFGYYQGERRQIVDFGKVHPNI